jgi:(E)-4-hydroxy-3-methylbut-2-enyl-diphosphate synthase
MLKRPRNKTRQVKVKDLYIGGDAPVVVQSMTNLPIEKVRETMDQIRNLQLHGAGLVRLALRNQDAVKHLKVILKETDLPLCADIHFDYRIALKAIDAGIHKIRINPGNIGSRERVAEVVRAARATGVPIRIGVNGGSVDRKKYPEVTPPALVQSAMDNVYILEDFNFEDIVISIKSSDVFQTIEANKLLVQERNYPVHVGLTEAGYGQSCIVQSSLAIGHLLLQGIGDTIRVSMTGDPVPEVDIGHEILKTVGDICWGIKIISCPTCGRTSPAADLTTLAQRIDQRAHEEYAGILQEQKKSLTIAIMGCEVNGPGEASHADIGIAGALDGSFLMFAKGKKLRKITHNEVIPELFKEIHSLLA